MIRLACTWVLVVLAASPFTAPFSTCDINTLLGAGSSAVIAASVTVITPATLASGVPAVSETGDAASISPLVGRVVLSRNSVMDGSIWRVPIGADAPVVTRPTSVQDARALEDPLQSPVLRL